MKQPAYPAGSHDSIQFHAFCDDKLFAARIFRTESIEHCSAWIFDGTARTVLSSKASITQTNKANLDVVSDNMKIEANEMGGRISVIGANTADSFQIDFEVGKAYRWSDTLEEVMHYPNLDCVVSFRGKSFRGPGYSKRYAWAKPPKYWGYRFLQGFIEDRKVAIWTADAVFGLNKYDYFKVLNADGTLFEIPKDSSAHMQNSMFGYVDDVRHQAEFSELGVWDQILRTDRMDSHLQQRYGRVRYFDGKSERQGIAITEYCFGTLG